MCDRSTPDWFFEEFALGMDGLLIVDLIKTTKLYFW